MAWWASVKKEVKLRIRTSATHKMVVAGMGKVYGGQGKLRAKTVKNCYPGYIFWVNIEVSPKINWTRKVLQNLFHNAIKSPDR